MIGIPFLLVLKQPDLELQAYSAYGSSMFLGWTHYSGSYLPVSPVLSLILSAIPLILSFGTEHGWGITGAIPGEFLC